MGSVLFNIGLTLDTLGKVMLGLLVIFIHIRIAKERRIDAAVIKEMMLEKSFGILGIALIIVGYFLQLIS